MYVVTLANVETGSSKMVSGFPRGVYILIDVWILRVEPEMLVHRLIPPGFSEFCLAMVLSSGRAMKVDLESSIIFDCSVTALFLVEGFPVSFPGVPSFVLHHADWDVISTQRTKPSRISLKDTGKPPNIIGYFLRGHA